MGHLWATFLGSVIGHPDSLSPQTDRFPKAQKMGCPILIENWPFPLDIILEKRTEFFFLLEFSAPPVV